MNDTNTAVATTEQPRAKPPVQAGGTISAMIPTDVDQAYRLAQAIARSGMTPKAYNNDPDKVFVGILAGAEIGLAPFQALQSIAVINGNPSIWGDGALALVQASGLLDDIEETDDGNEATCRAVRKGKSPIIRTFSMDDAKKAGLAGKTGPWTQYPQRMRQMRARSWALRDGFPDVLKGLHIAEEVRDRPGMVEPPQTTRLSSDMLARQAGVTVEQAHIAQADHVSDARDMVDAEVDEIVAENDPIESYVQEKAEAVELRAELAAQAQQTLDAIDGPLDDDQAEDEGPDPREAKASEIIAAVDKCGAIIDLRALHEREATAIEAMPEEMSARVTDAFNLMREALKRKAEQ